MKDCLVTYLRLRHHGSLTITEGREVKALLLLLVPLLEELLHAPELRIWVDVTQTGSPPLVGN